MKPKDSPLKPSKNPLGTKHSVFKTGIPSKSWGHITPRGVIKPMSIKFSVGDMVVKIFPEEAPKEKVLKKL